ncbi:MAG: hypothetical protein EAX95_15955, partial [Candidatus Thorarchaeota archaeon]|nr:hypothetical protein [Candidatus Thorarchaeota archaeon]
MVQKRTLTLLVLFVLISMASIRIIGLGASLEATPLSALNEPTLAYESHDPIDIYGDSGLSAQADDEDWLGDGTSGNPFLIQGYSIISAATCISIFSTTLHFVIQDCYLSPTEEWFDSLQLIGVSNGRVNSCHIVDENYAVTIGGCTSVTMENTLVEGAINALSLFDSYSCTFVNNTFQDGGLMMWTLDEAETDNVFVDNTARGKPLGYFKSQSSMVINGSLYGQVVLASCEDITVSNANIFGVPTGFFTSYCTNCMLVDSIVDGCQFGAHIMFSDETKLMNNIIRNSLHMGILVNTSDFVEISDNEIYSNWIGIEISEYDMFAITNNTVRGGWCGMSIYMGMAGDVIYNRVFDNTGYGICLGYGCWNASLYGNYLGWNDIANGYDGEVGNMWDDIASHGNYWDDYIGSGTYLVPGPAGAVDHFPEILFDYTPPIVTSPGDLVIESGSTGSILNWQAHDYFPSVYGVVRNDVPYAGGFWNSSAEVVSINLDELEVGVHNFTVIFMDMSFLSATDTVFVTVLPDESPPIISSPNDIIY